MIQDIYYANFDLKVRKVWIKNERNFNAVTLGEGSYIVGASLEYGSPRCHVLVGKYCSIAHGVKFIIGLNHDTGAVSTYPFDVAFNQKNNTEHKFRGADNKS